MARNKANLVCVCRFRSTNHPHLHPNLFEIFILLLLRELGVEKPGDSIEVYSISLVKYPPTLTAYTYTLTRIRWYSIVSIGHPMRQYVLSLLLVFTGLDVQLGPYRLLRSLYPKMHLQIDSLIPKSYIHGYRNSGDAPI
jgi:hypothetical protein